MYITIWKKKTLITSLLLVNIFFSLDIIINDSNQSSIIALRKQVLIDFKSTPKRPWKIFQLAYNIMTNIVYYHVKALSCSSWESIIFHLHVFASMFVKGVSYFVMHFCCKSDKLYKLKHALKIRTYFCLKSVANF